jgi:hypothetical protein
MKYGGECRRMSRIVQHVLQGQDKNPIDIFPGRHRSSEFCIQGHPSSFGRNQGVVGNPNLILASYQSAVCKERGEACGEGGNPGEDHGPPPIIALTAAVLVL